jgi:glutathione transport system substrate-binding protein
MEADRLPEGQEVRGYWKTGYPKIDTITWKPVVDNNTRSAVMQTGEADFAFSIPFEQAAVLKASPKVDLIDGPSIIQRYLSLNTMVKPFNDPKVRQAINYAINKEALAKVAFAGYAVPGRRGAAGRGLRREAGPVAVQPGQGARAAEGSRLPERLRDHAVVGLQPHHRAEGDPVRAAAAAQVGIKAQVQALEAGQRVERVESVASPRTPACACTTWAGRRRPVRRTGRCVRCWLRKRCRRSC